MRFVCSSHQLALVSGISASSREVLPPTFGITFFRQEPPSAGTTTQLQLSEKSSEIEALNADYPTNNSDTNVLNANYPTFCSCIDASTVNYPTHSSGIDVKGVNHPTFYSDIDVQSVTFPTFYSGI